MRIANPGEPLQEIGRTDAIEMPDEALAGIFICSHNADDGRRPGMECSHRTNRS